MQDIRRSMRPPTEAAVIMTAGEYTELESRRSRDRSQGGGRTDGGGILRGLGGAGISVGSMNGGDGGGDGGDGGDDAFLSIERASLPRWLRDAAAGTLQRFWRRKVFEDIVALAMAATALKHSTYTTWGDYATQRRRARLRCHAWWRGRRVILGIHYAHLNAEAVRIQCVWRSVAARIHMYNDRWGKALVMPRKQWHGRSRLNEGVYTGRRKER